jgi:hypothetical protein
MPALLKLDDLKDAAPAYNDHGTQHNEHKQPRLNGRYSAFGHKHENRHRNAVSGYNEPSHSGNEQHDKPGGVAPGFVLALEKVFHDSREQRAAAMSQ